MTPLVLVAALRQAGTRIFEPIQRFTLHVPDWAVGDALAALVVTGVIPAATVREFEQRVPGLTGGDGVFSSGFHGYEPVTGAPPQRACTDFNPLHRKAYLALVSQTSRDRNGTDGHNAIIALHPRSQAWRRVRRSPGNERRT